MVVLPLLPVIFFHVVLLYPLVYHVLQINPRNPLTIHYLDSQLFEDFEDLIDVHTILEDIKVQYEKKLEIAQAKQPKAEW